jgi:hypothetical protein
VGKYVLAERQDRCRGIEPAVGGVDRQWAIPAPPASRLIAGRAPRARVETIGTDGEQPPNGKGDLGMRFLMLVKASQNSEAGKLPDAEVVAAVMKYREELRQAGVLVDVAALHPTTEGTRVRISGGKGIVTDGPFAETKEAIGGFWLINVNSKAEAIEWAKRAPHSCATGEEWSIELRQLRELEEFEPAVTKVA